MDLCSRILAFYKSGMPIRDRSKTREELLSFGDRKQSENTVCAVCAGYLIPVEQLYVQIDALIYLVLLYSHEKIKSEPTDLISIIL